MTVRQYGLMQNILQGLRGGDHKVTDVALAAVVGCDVADIRQLLDRQRETQLYYETDEAYESYLRCWYGQWCAKMCYDRSDWPAYDNFIANYKDCYMSRAAYLAEHAEDSARCVLTNHVIRTDGSVN